MHTLVHVAAAAFACAWIGAAASSQTPTPDWSGLPGSAVSSAGDVNGDGFEDVIVGEHGFDNPQVDEGRAFVFLGSATGLGPAPIWTREGNQAGARFGRAVAGVGDVNGDGFDDVLVGAPYFDNAEGRAFLYLGSPTGPSTTPAWIVDGEGSSYYLGWDLSAAGDVNGDGLDDVLIGIPGFGMARVWHGTPSGVLVLGFTVIDGAPDGVGNFVSDAGDVNGDGFDDVIVGAPFWSNGQDLEGAALVFFGTAFGISTTEYGVYESNLAFDEFGRQVASAGDVDGDGFDDVAVTSSEANYSGRTSVFRGGPSGSLTLAWAATGFGFGLSAGDLNGDGFDDLIVGAPDHGTTPQGEEGRVVVYLGSSAGLSGPVWSATGDLDEQHFGWMVAGADVNGDGYCDLLVTDEPLDYWDGDGSVYAYHSSRFGLDAPPRHRPAPRSAKPRFP